jgi:hypothetical protein
LPAAAGELRLGWAVAASVSEWMSLHSLTLAATSEMRGLIGTSQKTGIRERQFDTEVTEASRRTRRVASE